MREKHINGHSETKPLVLIEEKTEKTIKKPSLYHVVLLNDDYTPMNFVIEILMHFFKKTYDEAFEIMMTVHRHGSGIAGTYPFEIATEKQQQVLSSADANDLPLNCIIEAA